MTQQQQEEAAAAIEEDEGALKVLRTLSKFAGKSKNTQLCICPEKFCQRLKLGCQSRRCLSLPPCSHFSIYRACPWAQSNRRHTQLNYKICETGNISTAVRSTKNHPYKARNFTTGIRKSLNVPVGALWQWRIMRPSES